MNHKPASQPMRSFCAHAMVAADLVSLWEACFRANKEGLHRSMGMLSSA